MINDYLLNGLYRNIPMAIEKGIRQGFNWLQKNHANWYAILISLAIIFWIEGIMGLIDYYFLPQWGPLRHIIISLVGLTILYLNDGKLSELYNITEERGAEITVPAAVIRAHRAYE